MLTEVQYGKHIQGEVIDFTMHECGGCGIPFFVPSRWLDNKKNNNGSFNCPNGCSRVFTGKTEAKKLKEELEKIKTDSTKREQQLQDRWLDALGEKNKLEKKLKRFHNGVCECCNRSFANLANHIKKQHPELLNK